MKIRHIILFFFIFTINIFSGYCVQVSGFIRENNSEESLIGTNIFCKQQKIGVSSDNRGYFSLALSMPCIITVSYAGYLTQDIPLNMSKDSLLLVKMITDNNLAEITVTATNMVISFFEVL